MQNAARENNAPKKRKLSKVPQHHPKKVADATNLKSLPLWRISRQKLLKNFPSRSATDSLVLMMKSTYLQAHTKSWNPTEHSGFELLMFYRSRRTVTAPHEFLREFSSADVCNSSSDVVLFFLRDSDSMDSKNPPKIFAVPFEKGFIMLSLVADFTFSKTFFARFMDASRILQLEYQYFIGDALAGVEAFSQLHLLHTHAFFRWYSKVTAVSKTPFFDSENPIQCIYQRSCIRINKEFHSATIPRFLDDLVHQLQSSAKDPSWDFLDYLSFVEPPLQTRLDSLLYSKLLSFLHGDLCDLDFVVVHKHFRDYLDASSFGLTLSPYRSVRWTVREDIYALFERLNAYSEFQNCSSDSGLQALLTRTKLDFIHPRSNTPTASPLYDFLSGTLNLDGVSYFRIGGAWRRISGQYTAAVRRDFRSILRRCLCCRGDAAQLTRVWEDTIHESAYNASYALEQTTHSSGFVCGDEIFVRNSSKQGGKIELFDLLFFDETTVYLFHVKDGFERDARVVVSQILISAAEVFESQSSPVKKMVLDEFITAVYTGTTKRHNTTKFQIEKLGGSDAFRKLFYTRKVCFVMAIAVNPTTRETLHDVACISDVVTLGELASILKKLNISNVTAIELKRALQKEGYIDRNGNVTRDFVIAPKTASLPGLNLTKASKSSLFRAISQAFVGPYTNSIATASVLHVFESLRKLRFDFKICMIPRKNLTEIPTSIPTENKYQSDEPDEDASQAEEKCDNEAENEEHSANNDELSDDEEGTSASITTLFGLDSNTHVRLDVHSTSPRDGACSLHAILGSPDEKGVYFFDGGHDGSAKASLRNALNRALRQSPHASFLQGLINQSIDRAFTETKNPTARNLILNLPSLESKLPSDQTRGAREIFVHEFGLFQRYIDHVIPDPSYFLSENDVAIIGVLFQKQIVIWTREDSTGTFHSDDLVRKLVPEAVDFEVIHVFQDLSHFSRCFYLVEMSD